MQCSVKKVSKRKNRLFSSGVALHFLLVTIFAVAFTGCSSVGRESFIQPVENFIPGKISFNKEDIYINVNQIEDNLAQQQVFQGIEPKIKGFNQQCNPMGQSGRLVLKINQRTLWDGYYQKNSLAITGEIYNEDQELLLQRTVLVSGKDSILQVKFQRKYIGSLVDSLTKDWMALASVESEE
ncbi:MAG: hypothetical protein J6R67_08180 [Treponema sp.]|nr:hypothetical protein [Treponema sp.]